MSNKRSEPTDVPERVETVRRAILDALRGDPLSIRELAARVGVRERDLGEHLEHLARSLRNSGERFIVLPPRCVPCGFVFEQRERLTKPSRCARCRSERVQPARFRVDERH
ncbi:MAG TPA: transcriptional regulator [Polyangiaceae bacterium]